MVTGPEPDGAGRDPVTAARAVAAAVPDPELPMLTVADLGILRDVAAEDGRLVVTITPTYSGCPALREIAHDLRHRLGEAGFADVTVRLDQRRRAPEAARGRHRPAAGGAAEPGSCPAHPDREPPASRVPAVRLR